MICGITDVFEVFLLSHTMQEIWVNHDISVLLENDIDDHKLLSFTKFAVSMDSSSVYITA